MSKSQKQTDKDVEFGDLVDSQESYDVTFKLYGTAAGFSHICQDVHAIKSLVLYRSVHKELPHFNSG